MDAQVYLGDAWAAGWATERDPVKAVGFYREAAESNHALGQTRLGRAYEVGRGVDQSFVLALHWLDKAAGQGNAQAIEQRGRIAEVWLARTKVSAMNGSLAAQWLLGDVLKKGRYGITRAPYEAEQWYRKAAMGGHTRSQCDLARMYLEGAGVKQDFSEARRWFEAAASTNDSSAQFGLAHIHFHGLGTSRDVPAAQTWAELAARQDFAKAKELLAQINTAYITEEANVDPHMLPYEEIAMPQRLRDYANSIRIFIAARLIEKIVVNTYELEKTIYISNLMRNIFEPTWFSFVSAHCQKTELAPADAAAQIVFQGIVDREIGIGVLCEAFLGRRRHSLAIKQIESRKAEVEAISTYFIIFSQKFKSDSERLRASMESEKPIYLSAISGLCAHS